MGDNGTTPDFSLIGLLLHADIVVQCVVAGLVLCSVLCWAIIFEKAVRLSGLRREVRRIEKLAAAPATPEQRKSGLLPAIVGVGRSEIADSQALGEAPAGIRDRLEEAMRGTYLNELRRLEGGLSFLATVGSAAPFIGLFGTVWGIMHSFTSIAASKDTSLAVVAPGIAEALFATAIGLAAAIPAVIAYNQIVNALARAGQRLSVAVAAIAKAWARSAAVSGGATVPAAGAGPMRAVG